MADNAPVTFIAHFTIDDPERYRVYEKGFFPLLKAHGGRVVAFDDNPTVLEGDRPAGRTVILTFDSAEALRTWWESPEYRALAEHRHAGTTTHSVIALDGGGSR